MIVLSQRDIKWNEVKLSPSNLTMGRYGCTTTCISMLSDYFKCFVDPGAMVRDGHVKYTREGLILWSTINFSKFKFSRRFYGRDDFLIQTALKDPKKAVILEVDHSHWVVAIGRIGDLYRIADPWRGDKAFVTRYKKITGGAVFTS